MALINRCICGSSEFDRDIFNDIPLAVCAECKISRQHLEMTADEYFDFYKTDYHDAHQTEIGSIPYKERYEHDKKIAEIRFKKYASFIPQSGALLDIGSSNGAFVDVARDKGYDAYGVDFTDHPLSYKGPLEQVRLPTESIDVITMHDVFEHLIDPVTTLREIRRILKPDGSFIIDFPDFYDPAGEHHWRPIQHLWYFNQQELLDLLKREGFEVDGVDHPIPGKFVVYARNGESVVSDKTILLLPGMGDIYWTMTKLESFIKKHNLGIPQVYVWDFDGRPRSKEFVEKFPFVKCMGYWKSEPDHKILQDTYNTYKDWCISGYKGFDYYLSVNGLLSTGKSLELIKEYETNWYVPMFEPLEEREFGKAFHEKHGDYLVSFFSDLGMFKQWVKAIPVSGIYLMLQQVYKQTGLKVVLTGCKWDIPLNEELKKLDKDGIFVDLVAKTSNDQFFGLVKESRGFIGWCGGNSVMSTVFKKPTIMFWSGRHFKYRDFFKNCCPTDSYEKWYFPKVVERYTQFDVVNLAKRIF